MDLRDAVRDFLFKRSKVFLVSILTNGFFALTLGENSQKSTSKQGENDSDEKSHNEEKTEGKPQSLEQQSFTTYSGFEYPDPKEF